MAISAGDKVPSVKIMMATENGPEKADAADILGGGEVALFSVPGAFHAHVLGQALAGVCREGR